MTKRLRLFCTAAIALVASVLHSEPALAASAVEYPTVVPGYEITFPRDEGAHPEYRTEWWYVTGWLETAQGDSFGFQITFFRVRPGVDEENPSRFASRQLLFAHAAVTDRKRGLLLRDETAARVGFGLAEAKEGALDVHIDDWRLRRDADRITVELKAREFSLDLEFLATQPPLLHGAQGFSRKGPDPVHASYYYSLPQLATSGSLTINGREQDVRGRAWLDHEWMNTIMDDQAQGWDWVGLNLNDGGALMSLQMRNTAGREHWAFGTFRAGSSGDTSREQEVYSPEEIEWTPLRMWRSPRTGVIYPIEWRVKVGERTITLKPLMDDQENDARGSTGTLYWEGAVRAFDDRGRQIGRGYLELTGYGTKLRF